jgi:hypothetical protein
MVRFSNNCDGLYNILHISWVFTTASTFPCRSYIRPKLAQASLLLFRKEVPLWNNRITFFNCLHARYINPISHHKSGESIHSAQQVDSLANVSVVSFLRSAIFTTVGLTNRLFFAAFSISSVIAKVVELPLLAWTNNTDTWYWVNRDGVRRASHREPTYLYHSRTATCILSGNVCRPWTNNSEMPPISHRMDLLLSRSIVVLDECS